MDADTRHIVTIVPEFDLVKAFFSYAEDFYAAAHELASLLIEKEPVDTSKFDTYVFPLVFLYRQSLELLLKSIAFEKKTEIKERALFVKNTHHDLATILGDIIKDNNVRSDDERLEWLKIFLSDISRVDKESDSFRYPFNIECTKEYGKAYYSIRKVFEEQTYIDLYKIASKFEMAHDILLYLHKSSVCIDDFNEFNPVLIEDGDGYFQAVTGYGLNWSGYSQYVHGYRDAANYLRTLIDKSNEIANKFFFPMCYLYRNAVELILKEVWIDECREDYQKRLKLLNKKKHSIIGIWNAIRKWDENFWSDDKYDVEVREYFDSISDRCAKISSCDSKASLFRYPCDDHMKVYYNKVTRKDYMEIAVFMEKLYEDIEYVDTELYNRNDMLAEKIDTFV